MSDIQCGQCGRPLEVPPGTAGQPIRCPQCGSLNVVGDVPAGGVPGIMPPPMPGAPPGAWTMPPAPAPRSGKATASLVLGLVSLVLWCCPLAGLGAAITGLVLGIQARKYGPSGKATAGIILSVIGIALSLVNAAYSMYLVATGQHPLFQGGQS